MFLDLHKLIGDPLKTDFVQLVDALFSKTSAVMLYFSYKSIPLVMFVCDVL